MKPRRLFVSRLSLPFAMAIAALIAAPSANAANQNWTGGGANANWGTALNWNGAVPGSTSVTTNADVATFNAAIANTWGLTGSPILINSATQNIGGISFTAAAGSYFVGTTAGNSLRLTSGGTIQILAGLTATNAVETINAPLVIQLANGTYTFANNSANGAGAGAGTLNFAGGITGGVAGATVLTLSGSNTNTNTISGIIGNGTATSLAVVKSGNGTWILSGANTFSGSLDIAAGRLRVSSASAVGASGTIVSNSTSTNTVFASTSATAISFSRSFSLNTVGGAITFGDTTGTGNLTFTGSLTRASGATNRSANVAGTTTVTFNADLLSPGATSTTTFTKGGTGTLAIKGTGSPTDVGFSNVVVTNGTLSVTRLANLYSSSSLGKATNATAGAVSITLDGGILSYIDGGAAASTTDRLLQIGRTTAAAVGTIRNDATNAAHTVTFSNTDAIAYGNANQTRSLVLGGTNSGMNTFASAIGDNGTAAVSLAKQDAGTWMISGNNTYTGNTTVTGGTLALSGSGAINNSSGITVNGSGVKLLQDSSVAVSPAVTLTQGTVTGSGTINTVNVGNATGGIISNNNGVAGAALTIGTLNFSGAAAVNTFHSAGDFATAIATTNLSTNGAGLVTINPSATVWTNGIYSLMSYTGSIGDAGAGQVALGTVSGLYARQTPVLADTGSAFTLTISGDVPKWTGLDDGNWQIGTTGANENWVLQVGNTATSYLANDNVLFDDTAAGVTAINISAANVTPFATTFDNTSKNYTLGSTGVFGIASGGLTKNGSGSLTITNANTYNGNTVINGGVLDVSTDGAQLYSGASPISAIVTVNSGGVLAVKNFGQGSTIGLGSPSLGNLANNGGQVILDGGTLRFNNETSSRGRVVNITAAGGTFEVVNSSAYTMTAASMIFAGSNNVLTLTGDSSSTGAISTVIGGTGVSVVKNGDAKWTLTGNNTYSGGTTINASSGILQATVTTTVNGLGTGAVSVGSGSTLILNNTATSGTIPINNTFSGNGLLKLQFAANTTARSTNMPNVTGFGGSIQLSSLGATGDKWNGTNLGAIAGSLVVDSGNTFYVSAGTTAFTGGITINGPGNNENRGAIRVGNSTSVVGGNINLATDSTISMENVAAQLTGNITSGAAGTQTLTLGGTGSVGGILSGVIGGGTGTLNVATAVGGTYTLTNTNTYSGTTTIAAGTLQLGNGTVGNDGTIAGTSGVINNSTLIFNRFGSSSAGYPIDGTGAVIKNGVGTQTLAGANTYGGATTVNAGTLSLDYSSQDNTKLGDAAALTLSGGTLNLSGGTHTEIVASTTLTAGKSSFVTRTGGSAVLQMGLITNNAGATIDFDAPNIATTSTLNNVNGILGTWATINNGADFAVNSTNAVDGLITAASYTDVTRLNGGTQIIADSSAAFIRIIEGTGSAANITLAAATTSIATLNQSTFGGTSAAVIDPAGQTLATSAILVGTGAGSLTIGTGTNNGNLQALNAGGDLTVNATGSTTVTVNSDITDNASSTLTMLGSGALALNGNNSFAGGTNFGPGNLQLGSATALGGGTLTIAGGSLDSSVTDLVNANNNAQAWNGNFSFVGTQNLDLGSGAVTLSGNRQVTVNAGTLKVGGVIDGAFALTKAGDGTLVLAGNNTYTGLTTVAAGTLTLTGNRTVVPTANPGFDVGGLGSPSATLNLQGDVAMGASQVRVAPNGPGTVFHTTGTLGFTGGSQLTVGVTAGMAGIYNLSGGSVSTVSVANRGLIIGVNADCNGTFNLSGTGNLTMAATSVLMIGRSENVAATGISAAFNQTGGTTTAGELRMGGNTAGNNANQTALLDISAGTFSAASFTALSGGNGSSSTINISALADVTLPAFPTTRGSGATATITFDGGVLKSAAASATYMQGLDNALIKAGGASIDTTAGSITVNQALLTDNVSLGGGLTKSGANSLTLTGLNTYTGVTTINEGSLQLGDGTTGKDGTISNTSSVTNNGTLVFNRFGGSTAGYDISGTGALTKLGVGTQTLTGINSYNGGTTITAGTLALSGGNNRLLSTGILSFDGASTFDIGSTSQTLASVTVPDLAGFTSTINGSGGTLTINGASNLEWGPGGAMAANVYNTVVNLSGLSNFVFDASSNIFRVGFKSGSSQNNTTTGSSTVRLAADNTITAANLNVGDLGANSSGGSSTLRLGAANTLKVGAINVGFSGRSNATLDFNAASSAVTIRNIDGSSAVTSWNIGQVASFSNTLWTDAVNFSNGTVDALVTTMTIGTANAPTNATGRAGTSNGSFTMAGGTLTATTMNLGQYLSGSGATIADNGTFAGNGTFTLNSASGTVNVTTLTLATNTGAATGTNTTKSVSGTFNLTDGTLNATTVQMGTQGGAATATAAVNWSTGTIANITGSDLTITSVPITLLTSASHIFNISGSNTATLDVNSPISGSTFGLTKSGTGTLTLGGLNTYTGDTTVTDGTLELADNAQLKFVLGGSTGVSNDITGTGTVNFDGDFVIDTTAADGLTSGTWTLVDHTTLSSETYTTNFTVAAASGFTDAGDDKWEKPNGPTKKYTFDETTGILTLGPSASYASWIASFPGVGLLDGVNDDPDFDGIANAVEMVIGGNPATGMDTALLPTIELVNADPDGDTTFSDYLLFTYRRSDLSVAAGVTADCETDTDLVAPWTPATGAPGVVILTDDNFTFTPPAAANTDRVRVYVPRAANTELFGRLDVQVP